LCHNSGVKVVNAASTVVWLLALALGAGCAGRGGKSAPPEGTGLLASLKEGMSMEEVIGILGEPTTLTEIRSTRFSEPYHELTYVNTVVKPGVVELHFRPRLVEILLDTEPYRDFEEP
jgi:hypothetical protein